MKFKGILCYLSSALLFSTIFIYFQNCSPLKTSSPQPSHHSEAQADGDAEKLYNANYRGLFTASLQRPSPDSSTIQPLANWQDSELLFSSYGTYSIFKLPSDDRIWHGGWVSKADPMDYLSYLDRGGKPESILGPDKIFLSMKHEKPEQSAASGVRVFAFKGYHVNDPTIIVPPSTNGIDRSKWLYMYFTMLDNRLAENCRQKQLNLLQCPELFTGHSIGMASSIDGGLTWTYRGIIVASHESGDGSGAWMPSVISVGNELHLYYSSGAQQFSTPNLFRLRLNANGISKVNQSQEVRVNNFQSENFFANIDVKSAVIGNRTTYLMVANSGDQKNIVALISEDGLNFNFLSAPLLSVSREDSILLTPQIEFWGENEISAPSTVGGGGGARGFIFLNFVYYDPSKGYEFRRHTSLHFQLQ